jgi:hypothetical protein
MTIVFLKFFIFFDFSESHIDSHEPKNLKIKIHQKTKTFTIEEEKRRGELPYSILFLVFLDFRNYEIYNF